MPEIESIIVDTTNIFDDWLANLRDIVAAVEIRNRIKRVEKGNFGDRKSIKGIKGISELRIYFGKGYRVYYTRMSDGVILLLCGGVKNEQNRDIKRAKK